MGSFDFLQVEWCALEGATVVALIGEIDMAAADVMRGIVAVAENIPRLVIDLERVTFLDLSGIDYLDELRDLPSVTIVNQPAHVEKLLSRLGRTEI